MTMGPDRQDRYNSLENFEQKLTNGGRGDIGTMCDHQVEMSKALRVMLKTDFVTPEELGTFCAARHLNFKPHPINWPTAGIIVGIVTPVLWKVLGC